MDTQEQLVSLRTISRKANDLFSLCEVIQIHLDEDYGIEYKYLVVMYNNLLDIIAMFEDDITTLHKQLQVGRVNFDLLDESNRSFALIYGEIIRNQSLLESDIPSESEVLTQAEELCHIAVDIDKNLTKLTDSVSI